MLSIYAPEHFFSSTYSERVKNSSTSSGYLSPVGVCRIGRFMNIRQAIFSLRPVPLRRRLHDRTSGDVVGWRRRLSPGRDSNSFFRRHALFGFMVLMLVVVGMSTLQFRMIGQEEATRVAEDDRQVANLALLLQQNVQRTAGEVDRTLQLIRQTDRTSLNPDDWATVLAKSFMVDDQSFQVTMIGSDGNMRSSSGMLHPDSPVFLGDREHFLVHKASGGVDKLFISKPLIGRVSHKSSIQFSRPVKSASGVFDGVIVASLDAFLLSKDYGDLNLGAEWGFAIVGDDDIVRSGAGSFKNALGVKFANTSLLSIPDIVVKERQVPGYPLRVVVALDGTDAVSVSRSRRLSFLIGSLAAILVCVLVAAFSVRSSRRYERRIVDIAQSDALTGLANRRSFASSLEESCAAANLFPAALLLIDLDGFKPINDTYGHPVGDALLKAVADRLVERMPQGSVVARLGGDEFAVILRGVERPHAAIIGALVCRLLATPFVLSGLEVRIGGSVGISYAPTDATVPEEMMRLADLALYESKKRSRGVFTEFESGMDRKLHARKTTVAEIERAIQRREFQLQYQPMFSLADARVTSYEALVRWNHPVKGVVLPSAFVPEAGESGMLAAIGDFVLEQVARDLVDASPSVRVAVHCCPAQLRDPGFSQRIAAIFEAHDVPTSRLVLEMEEPCLAAKQPVVLRNVADLRELGVGISMDNFGAGAASLSHLARAPLDSVKLDRRITTMLIKGNLKAVNFVRAVVHLAQSLGLTVVAEGVETLEQAAILREVGCNEAQGFFFGSPRDLGAKALGDDKVPVAFLGYKETRLAS